MITPEQLDEKARREGATKAGAPTLLDAESGLLACSVAPRTAGVGAIDHLRVQHPSVRSAMHKSAGTSPNEQVAPRAAGDGSSNCKQAQREQDAVKPFYATIG